ncbi:MAG: DUF2513 domain-containing protein [Rhizobiales bacterium]|nr:DUF2513 domain-containing protein [Hyphomicrobiales bacterium]
MNAIPVSKNTESTYDYSHWVEFGAIEPIRHWRIADVQHDIDLVKTILKTLRDKEGLRPAPVFVAGHEPVFVARHVQRLHDAGLIEGRLTGTLGMEAPLVWATDLSMEGHNFLGALEVKEVWNKLKTALSADELASLPLTELKDICVELAGKWARKKLGIDD